MPLGGGYFALTAVVMLAGCLGMGGTVLGGIRQAAEESGEGLFRSAARAADLDGFQDHAPAAGRGPAIQTGQMGLLARAATGEALSGFGE